MGLVRLCTYSKLAKLYIDVRLAFNRIFLNKWEIYFNSWVDDWQFKQLLFKEDETNVRTDTIYLPLHVSYNIPK